MLENDYNEKILDTKKQVRRISKIIFLDYDSEKTALRLVEKLYSKQSVPTKNEIGLAAAAIYVAYEMIHEEEFRENLPVTKQALKKNIMLLKSFLFHEIMEKNTCH